MSGNRHDNDPGRNSEGEEGGDAGMRQIMTSSHHSSSQQHRSHQSSNNDDDMRQVMTHRRLTNESTSNAEDSSRIERRGKVKSVTTRVVKKTTTVTRGDQRMVAEGVMKTSESHEDEINDVSTQRGWHLGAPKRAKLAVSSAFFFCNPKDERK